MSVRILRPHVAINVKHLPTSLEFYRKLFGVEPAKVRTGYAKFDIANPPMNFTLNEHAVNDAGALSHLGFQVASTEDVLTIRQQWHESGLLTRDEMQTSCCFARQDKTWVDDPDGNEWEVFVVLEDNLPEETASAETASLDTACCAPTNSADPATMQPGATCGCPAAAVN